MFPPGQRILSPGSGPSSREYLCILFNDCQQKHQEDLGTLLEGSRVSVAWVSLGRRTRLLPIPPALAPAGQRTGLLLAGSARWLLGSSRKANALLLPPQGRRFPQHCHSLCFGSGALCSRLLLRQLLRVQHPGSESPCRPRFPLQLIKLLTEEV